MRFFKRLMLISFLGAISAFALAGGAQAQTLHSPCHNRDYGYSSSHGYTDSFYSPCDHERPIVVTSDTWNSYQKPCASDVQPCRHRHITKPCKPKPVTPPCPCSTPAPQPHLHSVPNVNGNA
jgi:hypothetical protein